MILSPFKLAQKSCKLKHPHIHNATIHLSQQVAGGHKKNGLRFYPFLPCVPVFDWLHSHHGLHHFRVHLGHRVSRCLGFHSSVCVALLQHTEASELLPLQQFHVDDSNNFTLKIYFATISNKLIKITIQTSNDFQCTILDTCIRNRSGIKL